MKKRLSVACALASLLVLAAAPAFAEDTAPAKASAAKDAKQDQKGYGYTFEDDPLNSGVSGLTGFVLKVRPKGAREVLLRPRTSFVPELLKTVEAL
jgi:hypothetical protein